MCTFDKYLHLIYIWFTSDLAWLIKKFFFTIFRFFFKHRPAVGLVPCPMHKKSWKMCSKLYEVEQNEEVWPVLV